jgi:YgiT-type zinc finger domain-containing protein
MSQHKCEHCGALPEPRLIDHLQAYQGHWVVIENLPALVCPQCGATYFTPETHDLIASSIQHDLAIDSDPAGAAPSDERWGQKLVRMIDQIGPIDLIYPEIEDATEWVKQIRRDQEIKRGLDIGD